jgi:hypothetical protein
MKFSCLINPTLILHRRKNIIASKLEALIVSRLNQMKF